MQADGSMVKKGGSGVKRAEQSVKGSLTSSVITEEEKQETDRAEKGTGPGFSQRWMRGRQGRKATSHGRSLYRPGQGNVPESGTGSKAVRAGGKAAENTVAVAGKTAAKGASASAAAAGGAATGGTATAAAAVLAAAKKAKEAFSRMKDAARSTTEGSTSGRRDNMADVTGWAAGKGGSGKGMGTALLVALPVILLPMLVAAPLLLAAMTLSGVHGETEAEEILAVAKQEEAAAEENIGGIKYKTWYGIDGNWCAMFVSWCSDQCGYIEAGIMPKAASVQGMLSWYRQRDQYQEKESGYEPQAGDIVFFTKGRSHVGIVISYDPSTKVLTTMEGNAGESQTEPYHMGSRVKEKRYPITYDAITGYGTPQYPDGEEGDTKDPDIPVTVCRMKWLAVMGTEKNRKERL